MRLKGFILAAAAAVMLSACGEVANETTQHGVNNERKEREIIETVQGKNTGQTNISIELPQGDWGINFNNSKSTAYVKDDVTITTSVVDDTDTSGLPESPEDVIKAFSSEDTEVEVLDFKREPTEKGTELLRYTAKSKKFNGDVRILVASSEILDERTVIVADGTIMHDADENEIAEVRAAVESAVYLGE